MVGVNTSRSISSTPGIWGRPSIRERRKTTPTEMVGYVDLHSPEWGVLRTWASLIREAGDICGDEVVSAADAIGDGGGLEDDDSPGPEVRAPLGRPGPPSSPLRQRGWGPRSHPCLVTSESQRLGRYGLGDR